MKLEYIRTDFNSASKTARTWFRLGDRMEYFERTVGSQGRDIAGKEITRELERILATALSSTAVTEGQTHG